MTPTTPVFAIPSWTSSTPNERSRSATKRAAPTSSNAVSGFERMRRRHSVICGR